MKIAKEKLYELVENKLATGKVEFLTEEEAQDKVGDGEIFLPFIKNRSKLEKEANENGKTIIAYEFFNEEDILVGATYDDSGKVHIDPVIIRRKTTDIFSNAHASYIIIKVDENDLIQE